MKPMSVRRQSSSPLEAELADEAEQRVVVGQDAVVELLEVTVLVGEGRAQARRARVSASIEGHAVAEAG